MKVAVAGCAGRMGRLLVAEVIAAGHDVVAGTVSAQGGHAGRDVGTLAGLDPLGLAASDDPAALFNAEAIIDFTRSEVTRRHLELAVGKSVPLVIGTTGMDAVTQDLVTAAARTVPVMLSANFSRGVALLERLAGLAAAAFPVDDLEIVEMHHRNKLDAPSGTALSLGRAVATARQVALDEVAVKGRYDKRQPGSIGFAALRGGSVIGDHTVVLALDGERVELTHRADDRRIYAKGAVAAAVWLKAQPPGLYRLQDMFS